MLQGKCCADQNPLACVVFDVVMLKLETPCLSTVSAADLPGPYMGNWRYFPSRRDATTCFPIWSKEVLIHCRSGTLLPRSQPVAACKTHQKQPHPWAGKRKMTQMKATGSFIVISTLAAILRPLVHIARPQRTGLDAQR